MTIRHAKLLLLALILAACSQTPAVMQYYPGGAIPTSPLVWPPPPETARLEYAGQLLGEENFVLPAGQERSRGGRLLRWLAGLTARQDDALRLIRPQSGAVDARGRILVSDAGLRAIVVFDGQAGALDVWDEAAPGRAFRSPVGIACTSDNSVLVADAELGFVARLHEDGTPSATIGVGQLERPAGVAVSPRTGEILIADSAANDIKVFDAAGTFLRTIGAPGTHDGEFNGPTHISMVHNRLYVSDTLNARVQVLGEGDEPLESIGQRGLFIGNLVRPKGVTADSDGNVYVVESYYDHVIVFDHAGNYLLPIGGTGDAIGQFFLPAGIWSDDENRIFVADMFNGRVIIFKYLGDQP